MFIRRIATSACVLCVAIPATAVAAPGTTNPPKALGPYGSPAVTGAALAKAKGPYGSTPLTGPVLAKATGPYGSARLTGPVLAPAKGPYGSTPVTGTPLTRRTTHAAAATHSDGVTGWRIAAIAEAALLAAVALASMALLTGRGRAARTLLT